GDNMHGNGCVLEIYKWNVTLDKHPKIGWVDQMALTTGESQQTSQRYGKHVISPEAAPDPFEFIYPCGIGRARVVSGVERPNGRADNKVSVESVAHQLTQHAHLNRSQTATPSKNKSRSLGGIGHEV